MDDGWSGANFDRPSFTEMMEGVENGEIKTVVTKDLSRLGRNYLQVGLEVNRLCSTGEKNVCSFLYGAAARAARALGYRKIITYTLDSEPGTTLRAAGWTCAGPAGGKEWTGQRKPNAALYPAQMKLRYEKSLVKEKQT